MPARVIKICGITHAGDAQAAVAAGATAVGFNFYPKSSRFIECAQAAEIAASLPPGICKVGVFVNEPPETVERIAQECGLDVAQLHGGESREQFPRGVRVWKALRVEQGFDIAQCDAYSGAEAILLDGPAGANFGGEGKAFSWSIAAKCKHKVILAGGLDAANVGAAIAAAHPWGVDACSRIERSPGRKDHAKMREFIQAAVKAEETK
ncbi:MAG: phosphoribosylanthranilate isomerase [Candidatus Solibacter usitatus]|nr:phosphoribosylanthranilate isomerase [Candidatus Solibacter usitatus]